MAHYRKNMMLSTKPVVHNISQRCWSRTKPRS